MIKFIRSLFFRLPSNEKRRQERRVRAYEIMLEQQVRDLNIKLTIANEDLQEFRDKRNDMLAHLRHTSSLQQLFIEACQLEQKYADFVQTYMSQKEGAAV